MKLFFFLVLMLAIDLIPLNCSRIFCTCSCLLDLLSLIPCLVFLLMSFHLGLVFSVHIFSSLDEGQELCVFAVDRFFFARCSNSCVLLKYFCLFVCGLPPSSPHASARVFLPHCLPLPSLSAAASSHEEDKKSTCVATGPCPVQRLRNALRTVTEQPRRSYSVTFCHAQTHAATGRSRDAGGSNDM